MISKIKTLVNTENKKRLIANFMSLSVLRGFQFLIPLITLPYLIRTIGVDKFGLVNFALSLGLYFGAIIQFGFGITATREIARHRDDPAELTNIYSATLSASILLALVSTIFFILIVFSFDEFNRHLSLYLSILAFVVFRSLFPIWFFQGMEKMKYITFLTIGGNIFFLVGLFLFVKIENDFVLVPLLQAFSESLIFFVSIILVKKEFKVCFEVSGWGEVKSIYKNGYHAFISQLAPNLYNNSSVFLLGIFADNSLVGLYTAATKVIDAVVSLAYILSNTFLPYLSRNLQKHKMFQKVMLSLGFIFTIFIFVMAKWITIFLFGTDNMEISTYIQWMSICIFVLFSTMTYGTNFLMLIGKEKIVKNIALYTSIIFFCAALIIIPLWGIWGAIATLVGARLSMAIFQFCFYIKYKQLG